jgi:hypothetical protein
MVGDPEDPALEGVSGREYLSGHDHPGGEEEDAAMPHAIQERELVGGTDTASEMELEANAE